MRTMTTFSKHQMRVHKEKQNLGILAYYLLA